MRVGRRALPDARAGNGAGSGVRLMLDIMAAAGAAHGHGTAKHRTPGWPLPPGQNVQCSPHRSEHRGVDSTVLFDLSQLQPNVRSRMPHLNVLGRAASLLLLACTLCAGRLRPGGAEPVGRHRASSRASLIVHVDRADAADHRAGDRADAAVRLALSRSRTRRRPTTPDWDHSIQLELVIWAAPLLIIIALGALTWISTHTLDPYRPLRSHRRRSARCRATPSRWSCRSSRSTGNGCSSIPSRASPRSTSWRRRWTGRSASRSPSSSVMNSFYVPALAGMIYAMPGMETKLHAVINQPGELRGLLGQLQRRRLLRHALQVPRRERRRLRRAGCRRPRPSGRRSSRDGYLQARAAERARAGAPLRHRRRRPVRRHRQPLRRGRARSACVSMMAMDDAPRVRSPRRRREQALAIDAPRVCTADDSGAALAAAGCATGTDRACPTPARAAQPDLRPPHAGRRFRCTSRSCSAPSPSSCSAASRIVAALTYFRALGPAVARLDHQHRPQEDRHHVHRCSAS